VTGQKQDQERKPRLANTGRRTGDLSRVRGRDLEKRFYGPVGEKGIHALRLTRRRKKSLGHPWRQRLESHLQKRSENPFSKMKR